MKKDNFQELSNFVKVVREKYIQYTEQKNDKMIEKCIKKISDYQIADIEEIFGLDVEELTFFVTFNSNLNQVGEVCESVAYKIACAEGKGISAHTFCAFMAKSVTIDELEPECIFSMMKLLQNVVENSCSYNFEYAYLKTIEKKLQGYMLECREELGDFYTLEDYQNARAMVQMADSMIKSSALKKAKALGWYLVK